MSEVPEGFELENTIGSGGFSTVWRVKEKSTKRLFAIKKLDKTELNQKKKEQFFNEVNIMKMLNHKNIVRFHSLMSNKKYDFLVMECIKGVNLKEYILDKGKMSEQVARNYFLQILNAIDYFHKKTGLLHRDIKAENIMIDEKTKQIKIIDFGLSGVYSEGAPCQFVGSPKYVAPEIYEHVAYGQPADIWSLGVILFFMTAGHLPFEDDTMPKLSILVRKTQPRYPLLMSDSLKEFISSLLSKKPQNRPSIDKIREQPWIKGETIVQPRKKAKNPRALTKTKEAVRSTPDIQYDSIIDKLVATGRFIPLNKENNPSQDQICLIPKRKHKSVTLNKDEIPREVIKEKTPVKTMSSISNTVRIPVRLVYNPTIEITN